MSAGVIVLWRHGRTAHNAAGRIQGQIDIPLDEIGRWQIDLAANSLASHINSAIRHGGRVHIVTSDLLRAADTAAALSEVIGVPAVADARLRERGFGRWEGLTREEIAADWPAESETWRAGGDIHDSIGTESVTTVTDRVTAAVREYAEKLNEEDVLVVVSHGAAIGSGLSGILDVEKHVWNGLDNAHWAVLIQRGTVKRSAGAYRVSGYNQGPEVTLEEWSNGPIEV